MSIWSAEIKELERLYESFKGQLPELEKELEQLIKFDDPNVILLYSRRCLEVIITDLCECELKRPRKTEPLKGIIDKLHKEEKVPSNIITSMDHLNSLSAYGAHPKDFDPEQVKPVLVNLDIIVKWYLKYRKLITVDKTEFESEKARLKEKSLEEGKKTEKQEIPAKFSNRNLLSGIVVLIIFVIAVILAYPKIFKQNTLEKLRASGEKISVVVMPFQNMTNDTVWNVWQDGIQDMLITTLSNYSNELIVRQAETINNLLQSKSLINYASVTPSVASSISQKLDANVFIYGNIKHAGSLIRVYAQLIDSKTVEVFKSFLIEDVAKEENIFQVIDSLSLMISNYLVLSIMEKEVPGIYRHSYTTNSPEAYRCFLYGNKSFLSRDYLSARNWYQQALDIDTNMTIAAVYTSLSYSNQDLYEQAKEWCLRVYNKRNLMPLKLKLITNWLYAFYFGSPYDEIKYLEQLIEIKDYGIIEHYLLGNIYMELNQYDKAIPEYEKVIELSENWGIKPFWIYNYTYLGTAYHKAGQFKNEKKLYKKAERDFPDYPELLYNQAVLELSEGKIETGNNYIKRYMSICKDQLWSEARTINGVANIFLDAGILDKAEENYRKALFWDPENLTRMNNLAYFLIDADRNLNEGLELVDKALKMSPDSYLYLDTKGWGLFKQGKYQEALEVLQKSWDLKPTYDHDIYLHLEAVKKAVANQKIN